MKKNNFILKTLLALVLAFVGVGTTSASNFVDEINGGNYGAGQHVIYELNIGSFTQDGTFQAAQAKLQDLKSLGVDIVWVMPIYPRDGGQNSPYAAVDFKAVNPSYGTVADLRNFVSAAHGLGMQVWLDWVPNHTSTKNAWVTEHPEYYTKSGTQNVHPASDGNYYLDGQDHANNVIVYNDVYQLNYNNTGLRNAMNDCLKYWIDQADIDGYRCDMVSSNGIPADYWSSAIPLIKNYKSGKTITFLGEGDFSNDNQARLRNVGFDYDYAWNFQESILQNSFGASDRGNALKINSQNFVNTSKTLGVGRMLYLTNHDQNFNGEKQTLRQKYGTNKYLLTVLTYTLYGMPLIYNGEEVGGEQALNYFQDTKIDWTKSDKQMKNTLRVLGALKHSQAALHDGKTSADNPEVSFLNTINNNQYIVAYSRKSGNSEVIVILNTATTAQTALLRGISGDYSKWLSSDSIAYGIGRTDYTFNGSLSVNVPAKGYVVYVKGKYGNSFDEDEDDVPVIDSLSDEDLNSVYYESDLKNANVHVWFWSGSIGGDAYSSAGWPGDAMTMIGKTPEGKYIYKLAFDLKGNPMPTNLIITENGTDDANKIINGSVFVNHGYYVKGQANSTKTVPYTGGSSDDDVPVIDDLKDNTSLSIFYESDLKDASVHAWFYNGPTGGENYTSDGSGWPGDAMTMIGKTPEGKYIYKVTITLKAGVPEPTNVIITENGDDDNHKPCGDATFTNHGYYVKGVTTGSTKTLEYDPDWKLPNGIASVKVIDNTLPSDGKYYDLSGREIAKPTKGFFIHDGKKYIN